MNFTKTFSLLAVLTALFMAIGYAIGGNTGVIFAFLLAAGINFFSYWHSDKIVLKMTKAAIADRVHYKLFYDIVEDQVRKAHLPMPKLYVIQEDQPNAFATGRNPANAAVAVTTGIWRLLSKEEISGVIAHELAHIKNRDTLTGTIAATFAGAISMIANMLMFMNLFSRSENRVHPVVSIAVMLIAPITAAIIQMAISRNREYAADKLGGKICGNPLYLAGALRTLESYSKEMTAGPVSPATAHMYIINPFKQKGDNLFSTHPNTINRVRELEQQAEAIGYGRNSYHPNHISAANTHHRAYDTIGSVESPHYKDKDVKNNPWLW